MFAQRVVIPSTGCSSWTVVGADLLPVPSVEAFLAHLTAVERSPLTVRTYAHDLAVYFRFLAERGVAWDRVDLDVLSGYVLWLRRPAENVVLLDLDAARRDAVTVNRMCSAVSSLYAFHARLGVAVAERLVVRRRIARREFKPFLHHATKNKPAKTSALTLRTTRRLPATLEPAQVQALLDACDRLRDRFLIALLYETGMRIGQALGLHHEDVRTWDRVVAVVPRADNANGARAKTRRTHELAVSAALCRLYGDYMHAEYGEVDSRYVFVNLWAGKTGHAMSYGSVRRLVERLRARTGVGFHPHQLRHFVPA